MNNNCSSDPGKGLMLWPDSPQVYYCRWLRCTAASRRSRYQAEEQIHTDPSAACLPACKSGVFVLGDVRAQHAVHYSWRYATAETLFQRSRTESDQLDTKTTRKSDIDGSAIYASFPVMDLWLFYAEKNISGTAALPSLLISAAEDGMHLWGRAGLNDALDERF